ncbi:MAG: hydrogenase maturation nickel metallochaperone HypA [Deltaproteobacteria bacterium]|nr:hydrogenase maturation nickel metallochaperone HypA [Deltaproteobacteria bacterium]
MHELSIAQSLVEIACDQAEQAGAKRVTRVSVLVGLLSGVVPDSLSFCFPIVCQGTAAEGAELAIQVDPAKGTCPKCGVSVELNDFVLICPSCGAFPIEVRSGRDLKVTALEVEE